MAYYIAIDSGGTKTEAIVADDSGHILHRTTGCGCNPMDVGVDAARSTLIATIRHLQALSGVEIASLYAGIAGANHADIIPVEELRAECGISKVRIEDDRRIVVSGTLGHVNGCGLICGTGSSLSILIDQEPVRQVGGLGYLIDTGGSGFELGQAALKQMFRYMDGRGEYTVLYDLISKKLGKCPWESLADIYAGGRPFIASLACTVFEGMAMGDAVCRKIVEEGAMALSELTHVAARHFEGEFPVVMTGGILSSYPEYAALVRKNAAPNARMMMSLAPPVYGALVEAMWQNGMEANDETRRRFMADYEAIRQSAAHGSAARCAHPA